MLTRAQFADPPQFPLQLVQETGAPRGDGLGQPETFPEGSVVALDDLGQEADSRAFACVECAAAESDVTDPAAAADEFLE